MVFTFVRLSGGRPDLTERRAALLLCGVCRTVGPAGAGGRPLLLAGRRRRCWSAAADGRQRLLRLLLVLVLRLLQVLHVPHQLLVVEVHGAAQLLRVPQPAGRVGAVSVRPAAQSAARRSPVQTSPAQAETADRWPKPSDKSRLLDTLAAATHHRGECVASANRVTDARQSAVPRRHRAP